MIMPRYRNGGKALAMVMLQMHRDRWPTSGVGGETLSVTLSMAQARRSGGGLRVSTVHRRRVHGWVFTADAWGRRRRRVKRPRLRLEGVSQASHPAEPQCVLGEMSISSSSSTFSGRASARSQVLLLRRACVAARRFNLRAARSYGRRGRVTCCPPKDQLAGRSCAGRRRDRQARGQPRRGPS